MDRKHNEKLVPQAKELRKNMTPEERHLWYDYLSGHSKRFTRQKVLGRYIADFFCAEAKLVIELDGSQHYENEGQRKDEARTEYLKGYDITVIRIPNNEVKRNFRSVCDYIDLVLAQLLQDNSLLP